MAKLYGLTIVDPAEAPLGLVGSPSTAVSFPQGFTVPSGKLASVTGTLTVTGTTNLSNTSVSGPLSVSTITSGNVILDGGNARGSSLIIGTDDNFQLFFKTNDVARGFISAQGEWNWGTVGFTGNHICNGGILFANGTNPNTNNTALSYYSSGTFSGSLSGFSTSPSITVFYVRVGGMVILTASSVSFTSNATTMSLSGLPSHLTPATSKIVSHIVTDDGVSATGRADVTSSSVINFYSSADAAPFVASGTKGFPCLMVTYTMS